MASFYFISFIRLIKINNPKNNIKIPENKSILFNILLLIFVISVHLKQVD